MSTENKKKSDCLPRISMKDGFILWTAYHLFDTLRQVSLFQQIRNISKWLWEYKYKKKHPNATQEEHDIAWKENPPFTSSYLFPELWVIFNILLAIVGCIVVSNTSLQMVCWIFLIYALCRTFELFVYQINVLLFDPIKSGGSTKYRIKSATRIVLLLICNIFEYILWFSVVYLFIHHDLRTPNIDGLRIVLESFTTLANVASPEDYVDYNKDFIITLVAYVESIVGIFINIVCLARFISLLPPVQSLDEN